MRPPAIRTRAASFSSPISRSTRKSGCRSRCGKLRQRRGSLCHHSFMSMQASQHCLSRRFSFMAHHSGIRGICGGSLYCSTSGTCRAMPPRLIGRASQSTAPGGQENQAQLLQVGQDS